MGFTPVTHFFGYQGRAAHPSAFDCSLGSTLGFASGVQLDAGVNGCAVAVKDVTRHPSQWRVGAVPILALLQPAPKSEPEDNSSSCLPKKFNSTTCHIKFSRLTRKP